MGGRLLIAEALAKVCQGHSDEKFFPLSKVERKFEDQTLPGGILNLRKLAALLRLADEADDPYLRPKGDLVRQHTSLVTIGTETIAWHWKQAGEEYLEAFLRHLHEKQATLVSSIVYLEEIGLGTWYLVLDPQVAGAAPFMPEAPVETFVGREEDLKKLHAIIRGRREGAITGVVGTGGIGKTELAKVYAQRYRNDYPGGVFWASMKGSTWKEQAPRILAELRPGAEPPVFPDEGKARDEVKKAVARQGALLIIDNVDEPDQIIEPDCHVLVTTRRKDAFGIMPRKAIQELPGLPKAEGVKLLGEILGADRVLKDRAAAERIVGILGGMPLALEIAAKHLADAPDLSFTDYIGLVQFKVAELRLEDAPDKDVVASLELSLDQLSKAPDGETLAALFEAASVCAASGFSSRTLGAAAGLVEADDLALSRLAGKLRNRSLLEFNEETKRYSIHPLLRQLAENQLHNNPERERAYRKNHCMYWLNFASMHSNDSQTLLVERDSLWQAMRQANQLKRSHDVLPLFAEYLSQTFNALLESAQYEKAFDYLIASRLINIGDLGLSNILTKLLNPLHRREHCGESFQAWVSNSLGIAYVAQGKYAEAINCYKHALSIARKTGNLLGQGKVLGNMGVVYRQLGKPRLAIKLQGHALEIARQMKSIQDEQNALGNMGSSYADISEYGEAIKFYEQTIKIARRAGDMHNEAIALCNAGIAYFELDQHKKANKLYDQALHIARRIGDLSLEGRLLGEKGIVCSRQGDSNEAIKHFEQQLSIALLTHDAYSEGSALSNISVDLKILDKYESSLSYGTQALETARRIGKPDLEASILMNMGDVYIKMGNRTKAVECLQESKTIYGHLGLDHKVRKVNGLMAATRL